MPARRNHHKQVLPNRRFSRLLPAAAATIALAGASFAGPAAARADTHRHSHHAGPPPKVSTTIPAAVPDRDPTAQPHSSAS
jgi:hypothetical protein